MSQALKQSKAREIAAANDKVRRLEREIVKEIKRDDSKIVALDFDTEHCFNGGMYARTMYLPAGCIAAGREHYTDHIFLLMQGKMQMEINGETRTLEAPMVIPGMGGTKKAAVAVEDVMMVTVEITDKTTVEAAEDELYEPIPQEIQDIEKVRLRKFDMSPVLKLIEVKK